MSEEKLNINQWAEEDRPREKLMRMGPESLTNAELLAILIGSGSTKESAVDLMKHILKDCKNNLNTLGKMSIRELQQYNGMGPAKAITVLVTPVSWVSGDNRKRLRNARTWDHPGLSMNSCIPRCRIWTRKRLG